MFGDTLSPLNWNEYSSRIKPSIWLRKRFGLIGGLIIVAFLFTSSLYSSIDTKSESWLIFVFSMKLIESVVY